MISFSSGSQDSRISTLLLSGLTHPRDAFALGKNCSQDFIFGGALTRKIWQLSKPEHQILQNFDIEFWFWWINLQTTESQPVRGRVYLCCECSCWKLVGESSEKDRAAVVAGCGGQSANSNSARFWGRQLEAKDGRVAILSHAISCSCVAWMWVACCVKVWLVPSRFSVFIYRILLQWLLPSSSASRKSCRSWFCYVWQWHCSHFLRSLPRRPCSSLEVELHL